MLISSLPSGPLRLLATRERERLRFQVGDPTALTFEDLFPLRGGSATVFGLLWPAGVGLAQLTGYHQLLPSAPSPLERGDEFFANEQFPEALAFYRAQGLTAKGQELEQARYKEGLCLVALHRGEEAAGVFEELAAQSDERWPVLAACQLWALRLQENHAAEAEAIFENLSGRVRFENLAALIPDELRNRIMAFYAKESAPSTLVLRPNPTVLNNLERLIAVRRLFGVSEVGIAYDQNSLVHACLLMGQRDRALAVAEEIVRKHPDWDNMRMSWARLVCGQDPKRALAIVDQMLYRTPGVYNPAHLVLLVERARIHIAQERWDSAEQDLDDFFRRVEPETVPYIFFSGACLIRGFLHERRDDTTAVQQVWRRGLPTISFQQREAWAQRNMLLQAGILRALTGEFSDAEAGHLMNLLIAIESGTSPAALAAKSLGVTPALLRDIWRTPRGHALARRIAFEGVFACDGVRGAICLAAFELLHQRALPGELSAEQEELLWTLSQQLLAAFAGGSLGTTEIVQLGLTWKGTTNFLGWGGVKGALAPQLRDPLAYVLGHRYLGLNQPQQAADFFRAAAAGGAPDSPLRRLAEAELEKLDP